MKKCPICNKPWPVEFECCPKCQHDLIFFQDEANVNMGNANAISGGVHSLDDHSARDSNNQTNSNNSTNSYNTTNNTTINEAKKSESELLKDNLLAYRLKCKELFDDGLMSENGESQLYEFQIALNLATELVLPIKEEVRLLSKKRKKQITSTGFTDIRQTKSIIEQNTAESLQRQLLKLESLMENYDDDSLKQVYYQMSSMLEPVRFSDRYEKSNKYEYWETYWAYVAYMLQHRDKEAYDALASLSRWHKFYPEQNDVILHIVGRIMQNELMSDIKSERQTLSAIYTPDLQLLLSAIDELLDKNWEQESIVIRPVHLFYVKTLFASFFETQKNKGKQNFIEREERERKERERKEREEREEREREERERKERERKEREEREEREREERERERKEREEHEREERERERKERERKERENREREEREKRERIEMILVWFERNLKYILGFLLIAAALICLKVVFQQKKNHENLRQDYTELVDHFIENESNISVENLHAFEQAYDNLRQMKKMEDKEVSLKNIGTSYNSTSGKKELLRKCDEIQFILFDRRTDPDTSEKIRNETDRLLSKVKELRTTISDL